MESIFSYSKNQWTRYAHILEIYGLDMLVYSHEYSHDIISCLLWRYRYHTGHSALFFIYDIDLDPYDVHFTSFQLVYCPVYRCGIIICKKYDFTMNCLLEH